MYQRGNLQFMYGVKLSDHEAHVLDGYFRNLQRGILPEPVKTEARKHEGPQDPEVRYAKGQYIRTSKPLKAKDIAATEYDIQQVIGHRAVFVDDCRNASYHPKDNADEEVYYFGIEIYDDPVEVIANPMTEELQSCWKVAEQHFNASGLMNKPRYFIYVTAWKEHDEHLYENGQRRFI